MIPFCLRNDLPCEVHKLGKYKKWKCGDVYSPEERHKKYEENKTKCADCEKLCTATYCKSCVHKHITSHLLGKKLPKEWCENISKGQREDKGNNWKGNKAGYSSLHKWVRKYHGNPSNCSSCLVVGERIERLGGSYWSIQWSNISKKYLRDISDWQGLCPKCHGKYDKSLKDDGVKSRISWYS